MEMELEGCIENIFGQKLDRGYLEVIVLDSGSHQNEARIVERLKSKYHRIRYLRSAREQRYGTINRGIKPARGRYLFLMDPRNRLRPGALEHLTDYLDAHSDVVMVWGDDELCQNPEAALVENAQTRVAVTQSEDGGDLLKNKWLSPHVLWRSTLHRYLGMFNSAFESAGDYEFALRVARHFPVHYLPVSVGIIKETDEGPVHRGALFEAEAENVRRLFQIIADGEKHRNLYKARKESPAISIIVPTWGQKGLLARALTSVQRQIWTDYEVILVNCSEESCESAIECEPFRGKARYVRLHPDSDEAAAWNAGLGVASGKWIAFLQEGGSYYPNHLSSLMQAARDSRHPVLYAGIERIEGVFQNGSFVATNRERCAAPPLDLDRLLVRNFIHLQAMLIEMKCFRRVGHFDPKAAPLYDWELALRLADQFTLHPVEEITSELWCEPPESENILAYEWIYARQRESVECRPEIIQARQEVLDDLCRKILASSNRERHSTQKIHHALSNP
jgi:glycosyltransferase involved in cell wall biosynthesis